MNKKSISRRSKTDWARVKALKDDQIDYSDSPKIDAAFFKNARLRLPEPKEAITIRLDRDILEWLRQQGTGYQTRINAVLRAYMEAHQPARRQS